MSKDRVLPSSWDEVRIGEVASLIRGVSYVKQDARTTAAQGHTALLRANNIQDGLIFEDLYYVPDRYVSDVQVLGEGDVVIAMSSGSRSIVGKAAQAGWVARCSFGTFCGVVRPSSHLNKKYFGYYFQTKTYRDAVYGQSKGTGINNLKAEHVLDRILPLPPGPEQERIASMIDELFSSIRDGERALDRVRKLVERYRQSVLKAAVTGELTRAWREKHQGELESGETLLTRILDVRRKVWEKSELDRMKASRVRPANDAWKKKYKEPPSAQTDELPELPPQWCWASVEQLSTKVVDGVHKKPNYVACGIPFVTVRNLTAGLGISFERLHYITPEDHAEFTKRTKPERGDVLVSKDGTLGTIRLVDTDVDFSIFVSVALVKPVVRDMGSFMELALSSPVVQAQMVPKGTGLQHIHLEDLRQDCLPLCSQAEQKLIADAVALRMSQIDYIEAYLVTQLTRSRELRQSVLRSAFSGQLVSQDPADEPASDLLKRIAAERASAPKRTAEKTPRKKKAKA